MDYTLEAAGSNALIKPQERTNDTWVGRVYSTGKNGTAHFNKNDLVMYHNDDMTEFDLPSFKDHIRIPDIFPDRNNLKIHSVIYYKVMGILEAYVEEKEDKPFNFEEWEG